jgi:thiol-disulfide isomerase/thioredoxin
MEGSIERLLPILATSGAWLFGALILGAIAGVLRLGWGRPWMVPGRWLDRIQSALLVAMGAVSAFLMWAVLVPMAPMLGQVRQLQSVVNRPSADVTYRTVADDSPHHLSELRGRVVVLNLWATWCGPCRRELPQVDRLQAAYSARGVTVVTLSTEERGDLQAFARQCPLATLNVYTPRVAWLDVPGRPLSLVIDRRGVVRACFIGARSYAEFEREVTKCLASNERV